MLILSSSIIYLAEHKAQPDKFSSIPAAMWWGVATLTTVGYGDVYPITALGKFFGSTIALLGVGIVALPAGIIASGFNEIMQERLNPHSLDPKTHVSERDHLVLADKETQCCPHCGQQLPRSTET